MAKKKTTTKKPRQRMLTGDGFPKEPPKPVLDARDAYLDAKRAATAAREAVADTKAKLIDTMHRHKFDRVRLDDESKFLEIERGEEKVKTKTIPKAKKEQAAKKKKATAKAKATRTRNAKKKKTAQ